MITKREGFLEGTNNLMRLLFCVSDYFNLVGVFRECDGKDVE